MNIHEYQAKELLRRFGVPTPKGVAGRSVPELCDAASALAPGKLVVKAQIHAGGRGKAGGVKVVENLDAARNAAEALMGATLVTPQTGPKGKAVHALLVEEVAPIAREFYAGVTLDRASRRLCLMVSSQGGMDIEEVAERHPESIIKVFVDPRFGLHGFEARKLALGLGLSGKLLHEGARLFASMHAACIGLDASLVEINPLVLTTDGRLMALDAKMSFDDAALYRHPELQELEDLTETDPHEHHANSLGMKFIKLDGTIAMMANGAGLAMTTMDIIQQVGGKPANFLDVSGGASETMIAEGVRLILADPGVEAIFINIFGGILRCDILARGLLQGLAGKASPVPIVMRMVGTNAEEGRAILGASGLAVTVLDTLGEAIPHLEAIAKKTTPRRQQ